MIKTEAKHLAWFLPIAYLIHLVDEYFFGEGFSSWFSEVFGAGLSVSDFIIINTIGLAAMILIVILYNKNLVSNFFIAAPGTTLFINGLVHIAASIITASYSPGTISAVIVYLPLGLVIFKKIYPMINPEQRMISIAAGIILQIIVAITAMNI